MLGIRKDQLTIAGIWIIGINRKNQIAIGIATCCGNAISCPREKCSMKFSILSGKNHCTIGLPVGNKWRNNMFGAEMGSGIQLCNSGISKRHQPRKDKQEKEILLFHNTKGKVI